MLFIKGGERLRRQSAIFIAAEVLVIIVMVQLSWESMRETLPLERLKLYTLEQLAAENLLVPSIYAEDVQTDDAQIVLSVLSADEDGLTYRVSNTSGEMIEVGYQEYFELSYAGQWYWVPNVSLVSEGYQILLPIFAVEPNASWEGQTFPPCQYRYAEVSTYRLIKPYEVQDDKDQKRLAVLYFSLDDL